MLPELSRAVAVVRGVADSLPGGCATFALHGDLEREVIASLTPVDPQAASVVVHAEAGLPDVDVLLGLGGVFEVPATGGATPISTSSTRFAPFVLAAVEGRYRETVWMIGDEVVRARGVVTIGSAQVPALWAHLRWNLLKRPKRHEFDYTRYEADAAARLTPLPACTPASLLKPGRAAVDQPARNRHARVTDTRANPR